MSARSAMQWHLPRMWTDSMWWTWAACAWISPPCFLLPPGESGKSLIAQVGVVTVYLLLFSGSDPAQLTLRKWFQVFLHLGRMSWLLGGPRTWECPSLCYCIQMAVMRGLEVGYRACRLSLGINIYIWDPVLIMSVAGDATVTISHRYTPKEQLRQHTKIADIIIAAAGLYPRFFNLNIFSLIFFLKKVEHRYLF